MGFWAIFEIIGVVCTVSDFIMFPLCHPGEWDQASIDMSNPTQSLKERLEKLPADVRINIPDGPIDEADVESIMASAISMTRSQVNVDPDAMTAEELELFLDGLLAPKPTTMLTVAASKPTDQSQS
ncbi:unnamed protein product [Aureobasidium uvarum]|uniref:Uncharacterized protein n=1 Tax=Aureobasidium uvarum TaxID=2773716 RepID=A0A9N8KB00_9PEZI|nr:unnamed protein product [Aureobasidium uvarum]